MKRSNLIKNLLILMGFVFIIVGCSKESQDDLFTEANLETTLKTPAPNKIDVCHIRDNGTWSILTININALPGHLGHGDVSLVDNDGDGWVVDSNECGIPSGDCDDNDPNIYPGSGCGGNAVCPCYNLSEALAASNVAYHDYRVLECAGPIVGITLASGGAYGVAPPYHFAFALDGTPCFDLTITEIEGCIAIIEQAQARLNLPSLCATIENYGPQVESKSFFSWAKQ